MLLRTLTRENHDQPYLTKDETETGNNKELARKCERQDLNPAHLSLEPLCPFLLAQMLKVSSQCPFAGLTQQQLLCGPHSVTCIQANVKNLTELITQPRTLIWGSHTMIWQSPRSPSLADFLLWRCFILVCPMSQGCYTQNLRDSREEFA